MTNETSLKIESLPSQSTNLSNHCNLQSQDLIDKRLKVFLIVWTKWQKRVENDSSENVSVMFALYVRCGFCKRKFCVTCDEQIRFD